MSIFSLAILCTSCLTSGALKGLDLLVMPGGRGDWQYAAMGEEGAQAVRDGRPDDRDFKITLRRSKRCT